MDSKQRQNRGAGTILALPAEVLDAILLRVTDRRDMREAFCACRDLGARVRCKRFVATWQVRNVPQDCVSRCIIMKPGEAASWVRSLASAGASVGVKRAIDFMRTALHTAAIHCVGPEVISALVDTGADVNARDQYGGTPLHFATCIETIDALLAAGADPLVQDDVGNTVLHRAGFRGDGDVCKALLGPDASGRAVLCARNQYGHRAVSYCSVSDRDRLEALSVILTRHLELCVPLSSEEMSCIERVMSELPTAHHDDATNVRAIGALLSAGVNVSTTGLDGTTALHRAAARGNIGVTSFLISRGARIEAVDMRFTGALCKAADVGAVEVVDALLGATPSALLVSPAFRYLLRLNDRWELIARMVSACARVKSVLHTDLEFVLTRAAACGPSALSAIDALLAIGVMSRTAIHEAAAGGHATVVYALLAAGADPAAEDEDGMTALQRVAAKNLPMELEKPVVDVLVGSSQAF